MATQVPVKPYARKTARGQSCNPEGCQRAWEEAQPRCGVTLDGVKKPIGHTRASSEAGTRRTHVRWSPTHGYQQDQPSCLTGSASSDGQREERDTDDEDIKNCAHPLTSEVISTLALTCCWKRERRRSGRCRQSGAALCSAWIGPTSLGNKRLGSRVGGLLHQP
jgi:hypothetical protein